MFDLVRPTWQARSNCHPQVIPHVWQQFEDCRSPADLFYPHITPTAERREAIATVCGACPVRAECYEHGLTDETAGWWGGVSEEALRIERKRRGIRVAPISINDFVFPPPGHGTNERYQVHIRHPEEGPPCEMCLSAHREYQRPVAAAKWVGIKGTETHEERETRLIPERARARQMRQDRRQGA